MAYMQKVKVAQARGRSPEEEAEGTPDVVDSPSEEVAEGETASATMSAPTQAKPKTLKQAAKKPVTGVEVDPSKAQAPSKIKVRSTDDLRSIYKKKFGKSQATIAEGDTVEGEDENYKKIAKQNA